MNYDEFSEKLRKVKMEYELLHGKSILSILELESFLDKKLLKPKSKGLKSLKGFNF